MSITVEVTYDMSKVLGTPRFELESAATVADVVVQARERFGEAAEEFAKLSQVAAISVNGVLVNYKRGLKTALADGDTVAFVKAAAGG